MKSNRKYSSLIATLLLLALPLMAQTDVTVGIGSVEYPAYADSILVPVTLDGPVDAVAGLQFDFVIDPPLVDLTDAYPDDDISSFSVDYNVLPTGELRVILFDAAQVSALPAAGDTVLWLQFDGSDIASAVIGLDGMAPMASDTAGLALVTEITDGSIAIGSVVSLSMGTATGDINEAVELDISLDNTDPVGGLQFDMMDLPDYLSLDSVVTTTRTAGFTVSTAAMGGGDRVIVFSEDNSSIAPGTEPILTAHFTIDQFAYAGDVIIDFVDAVVTDDTGGSYWIAGVSQGIVTVYPGFLEPPTSLTATGGLDGHVPLAWAPPVWDVPGDSVVEGFEGDVFPPEDWTQTITNTNVSDDGIPCTWSVTNEVDYVYEGAASAGLWWDYDHQDEWLITPEIAVGASTVLTFWCYGWEGSTNGDHYYVKVSTDGGTNWETMLDLSDLTLGDWNAWSYPYEIDLSVFSGQSVQIAWQAVDGDGAGLWYVWFLDAITVASGDETVYSMNTGLQGVIPDAAMKKPAGEYSTNGPTAEFTRQVVRTETRNTRDLSAYNIYRSITSPVEIIPDNLITTVPYSQLTYDDVDVSNGQTYYYVITGDYSEMGESGPSNEEMATPVEWVELSIEGGAAITGNTDTLDIYLNNESNVGFFFFEIEDDPDYLIAEVILPTDRVDGNFFLDVLELPSGMMSITGIRTGDFLAPGSEAICQVVVRVAAPEPAVLDLNIATAEVQDEFGNVMQWTQTGATFDAGVETQSIMVSGASGLPGMTATVSIMLHNTQNIHGIQLTLVDDPVTITGVSITPTGDVDLSNWILDGNEIDGAYTIIGADATLQNPIPPGMHHIADVEFSIPATTPWGVVDLTAIDVILSDINSIQLYTEVHTSAVGVGYPDAMYSVENMDFNEDMTGGTFDITITNQVNVYAVELEVFDMPDMITMTDVQGTGIFATAVIDAQTGEQDDGTGYIFAYELVSGITPTAGSILTVSFDVKPQYVDGNIMIMLSQALAADQNFQAIDAMAYGYLMVNPAVGTDAEEVLPTKFALHPNYPNPFNPTTNILYDLSEVSNVRLVIYDMMGREVRTLVNETQQPGRKIVTWNGLDKQGRNVSAGVYLYRIQANDHVATSKMVLLK